METDKYVGGVIAAGLLCLFIGYKTKTDLPHKIPSITAFSNIASD
jgi:hypothetical protein